MKIITAEFHRDGTPMGTCTGQFRTLPGDGVVTWSDDSAALFALLPPMVARYATAIDAQTFHSSMESMAKLAAVSVRLSEKGEWVYLER